MTTAPGTPIGTAAPLSGERLARAIAFGFLPGAVVFGALVLPVVRSQWPHYPPAWTVCALALLLLPTAAAGALAFRAPLPLIRRLAMTALVTGLLASATLPLVVRPGLAAGDAPWTYDIAPIGVILGVLALRPAFVVLAACLESVLLALDRAAAIGTPMPVLALQDCVYSLLFQIVFVALGVATLAAGRSADAAEIDAREAAALTAADVARERERERVNALVHDRVLATLLSAAHPEPGAEHLTRLDAGRALRDLRGLLRPDQPRPDVEARAAVWALQGVTTDIAPEATFGYELLPDACPVPAEALDTVSAAMEEALRNSMRHSAALNRTVHVIADPGGIRVDVLDDGIGFDPARLPSARLGIAQSILGRMRALPGGDAFVVAAPGVGARVQLRVRVQP